MFNLSFFGLNKGKASQQQHTPNEIKMIVGIGNPGDKYSATYHNAGILYIDSLTQNPMKRYKDFAFIKTDDLILVKSSVFMNQSGQAVKQALKYFDLKPHQMIIAHDDSDLTLGEYKIGFNQGSAGHNGIKSIISHIKTKEFFRLRIGVRKDASKAGDFVLKNMSKPDQAKLEELFSEIQITNSSL